MDKNKNATISSINKKDKCFQYTLKIALNHKKIGKNPKVITKIKSCINKYNWERINCPSEKGNLGKIFEKNNPTIALSCILPIFIILLMILNREGWHCISVKKHLALLRAIRSKHHADLYCLNCLHSFRTENKLVSYKKVCENKNFCDVF